MVLKLRVCELTVSLGMVVYVEFGVPLEMVTENEVFQLIWY